LFISNGDSKSDGGEKKNEISKDGSSILIYHNTPYRNDVWENSLSEVQKISLFSPLKARLNYARQRTISKEG
jgi:hypothetical protein